MRRKRGFIMMAALLLAGGVACGDSGLGSDTVARAGDIRLQVDEAARWIAPVPDLPADAAVVEALTDFWVDYTLLALVVNEEGALDRLDLSRLVDQEVRQEKVLRLRESVIEDDPEVSDEELLQIYETERPGERVRARHIMLLFPENATPSQRDSVQRMAEGIRERAAAGESFEGLAEIYSDDDGTASRGGDLGYIPRGTMNTALEEATFGLEPGEISQVVRTSFGVHIMRVDERDMPSFEEIGPQLRQELQMERTSVAESTFVAGVEEPAEIRITSDAFDLARSLARDPEARLSDRAARRALVEYRSGAFTAGDYRDFALLQPAPVRSQIAEATDEQLEALLRNQARFHLLVIDADERGITVEAGEIEELEEEIRSQYRTLAELLDIDRIVPDEGETLRNAVQRTMKELMPRLVRGEQDVYPLGNLASPLRLHYGVRVSSPAMERAATRIEQLRAEGYTGDEGPSVMPPPAPLVPPGGGTEDPPGNPDSGT
jgi:hypothetical protein